ncbi:MAG: DUF6089 family protein [Sediminibacterium sp.]
MMYQKILFPVLFLAGAFTATAQPYSSFVHQGEVGIHVGAGHYFGDINSNAAINRPKLAAGFFFRKQLGGYISLRLSGEYLQLGYSDVYSKNSIQQIRNLSFNSEVWEGSLTGEFNFFNFRPGIEGYSFTPYLGLGIGAFSYDPYAYLGGQKFFLRPLGTEGQGSTQYPDLQFYNPIALCIPFTVGVKYAFDTRFNVFAEFTYRFTNTDYLDDVSGVYVPDAFPPLPDGTPTPAFLLQDRSYESGVTIGTKGRQRGNSLQPDSYASFKVGISFNLETYRCPPSPRNR